MLITKFKLIDVDFEKELIKNVIKSIIVIINNINKLIKGFFNKS